MKITLYKKAGCPWSAAIIGFLNELNIPYEIKNVTSNPAYAEALRAASGQCMSASLDPKALSAMIRDFVGRCFIDIGLA